MFPIYYIKGKKELSLVYLLLAPTVIIITAFQLIPVLWNFSLSFTEGSALSTPEFVGLANFFNITSDRYFVTTLVNTLQFAFTIIPLSVGIGLALAILLSYLKINFLKKWFLGFIFFPLIPATLISAFLQLFNVAPIDWLATPRTAFWAIVFFEVWRGVGFYVVVLYGAILNVPKEHYEAARIDGCPEYLMFRHITIPMIKSSLAFCLIMATIWNFQIFDSVYLLTQGGPLFQTSTVSWYIYARAFIDNKVGIAATMSVVMFIIVLAVSVFQLKIFKEQDD